MTVLDVVFQERDDEGRFAGSLCALASEGVQKLSLRRANKASGAVRDALFNLPHHRTSKSNTVVYCYEHRFCY